MERDRPDVARRRVQWRKYQGRIDPGRLVFIDETWARTDMTRTQGWAPRGWSPRCRTANGRQPPRIKSGAGSVGEHRVDSIWNSIDQTAKKVASIPPSDPLMQFGEGELAGAIDSQKHVELALLGLHLGDIHVEIANRIRLELLLWFRSLDVWQTVDVAALEQAAGMTA